MAPRSSPKMLPCLLASASLAVLARFGCVLPSAFTGPAVTGMRGSLVARGAGLPGMGDLNMKAMEDMMKDPEKMKAMQAEVEKIMADPAKKAALESYQKNMQSAVEKLKDDPEMKAFFEDIEKNGYDALKKYEKDERILAKFSQATGGPMGMPGLAGLGGAAPPAKAAPKYPPGTEVVIHGLEKAPELNGKKAMVVPPTADEQKTLEGTDRLIVRLMDTGDQFAVKPTNLRSTAEAADEALSGSLEDVSMYNPALQTEAAKLRESGKLQDLAEDPELKPIFEDIKKNGMGALQKYWDDEKLMAKISKAMAQQS